MPRKRLAFLNLDREKHHTPHILPLALSCSMEPDWECAFYTQEVSAAVVERILPLYSGHALRLETPPPSPWKTLLPRKRGIGASHFIKRLAEELSEYDAVITPDTNLGPVAERLKQSHTKIVYSFHGAGDRGYPFETDVSYVDFFLLPGEKFRRRREELGQLTENNWAVVGYPKLEVMERLGRERLFPNQNPTVLYNPHHDRQQGSWFHWGAAILEFFYAQRDTFNFILAPHILIKPKIASRYRTVPEIHIDLDSPALVDGTYLAHADLYLGDLSSQVYEFFLEPRPAIFLNPAALDPTGNSNLAFWSLGRILHSLDGFASSLEEALESNPWARDQEAALEDTFSHTGPPPGERAVKALKAYLC